MSPLLSAADSRPFHQWCAQQLIRDALNLIAAAQTFDPQHSLMPSLAQIAYEAYCESRHWQSVAGDLLPQWHDQSQDLKSAWDAAAQAVKANLPPAQTV